MWRARFGRSFDPLVRQTAYMNELRVAETAPYFSKNWTKDVHCKVYCDLLLSCKTEVGPTIVWRSSCLSETPEACLW